MKPRIRSLSGMLTPVTDEVSGLPAFQFLEKINTTAALRREAKLREERSFTPVPESIARSHGRPADFSADPVVVISWINCLPSPRRKIKVKP